MTESLSSNNNNQNTCLNEMLVLAPVKTTELQHEIGLFLHHITLCGHVTTCLMECHPHPHTGNSVIDQGSIRLGGKNQYKNSFNPMTKPAFHFIGSYRARGSYFRLVWPYVKCMCKLTCKM